MAGKQKWNDGNWVLEVGWVGNGTVKGSNLSAPCGLKNRLFWDWKFAVCGCSIICSYVSSFWRCCVTAMCWIGLRIWFGLEFAIFTSAKFLKFCGTSNSGWLRFRLCSCGAVGILFVLLCDSSYVFGVVDNFVLYSFICASKSIFFMDVENIPKNPAKIMRATLAYLLTSVWIVHVLYMPVNRE